MAAAMARREGVSSHLLLVSVIESYMRLSSSALYACNFFNSSLILAERFSSPTLSLERSRYIFRGALHSLIQCPICPQLWHGRGSFCLSDWGNRPLSLLDWGNLSRSLAIPFFSSTRNRILTSSSRSTFSPNSLISAIVLLRLSQPGNLVFTPLRISGSTCWRYMVFRGKSCDWSMVSISYSVWPECSK